MPNLKKKVLVAFDFDHTVINANSDTSINTLAPGKVMPEEIRKIYKTTGWTPYMAAVFEYLHKLKVTKDEMLNCISKLDLTDGMESLITSLPLDSTEFIIISDSNSVFINHYLESNNLSKYFSEVFTNPAIFNDHGLLTIKMFHKQDYCSISSENLCKGQILRDYVTKKMDLGVFFPIIAYVGDGHNDLCPGLCLEKSDFLFARNNFNLLKTIQKLESSCMKCTVNSWTSGDDILKFLKPLYKTLESTDQNNIENRLRSVSDANKAIKNDKS